MQDYFNTKTTGNAVKNENIPRKPIQDINDTLKRWDQMLSKINVVSKTKRQLPTTDTAKVPKSAIMVFNKSQNPKSKINNSKAETAEQVIKRHDNKMYDKNKSDLKTNKSTVDSWKVETFTNKFDSTEYEMKKLKNRVKQLNEKLKQVTNELLNEKDKYHTMEAEKKSKLFYKEKLDIVLAEKDDLLKRLKECELLLAKTKEKINSISDESERKVDDYSEAHKKIEEERQNEWNKYQIQLENQNIEYQKALCRKEQFIKYLEFTIDGLTQEKQDLENNKMDIVCTKSNSHGPEELEMCKNKLNRLSEIVANMTCKFSTAEASFQQEIMEMRNTIEEKDKLIDSLKSKLLYRPETTLNSTRYLTTDIDY